MSLSYHQFDDREALIDALQRDLLTDLAAALSQRGRATLALSGGSTPQPLYQALSQQPLDWSKIAVTLSDERHVGLESPASNEAMLRRTLLQDQASEAELVSFIGESFSEAHSAADTATAASVRLQRAFGEHGFDLMLLGMGNDMHTASLFPDAPELGFALGAEQACVALNPPSASEPRLSLSLPWLLKSRRIILLITGADKWKTLEQAMSYKDPLHAPISAITDQTQVPVSVYWSP